MINVSFVPHILYIGSHKSIVKRMFFFLAFPGWFKIGSGTNPGGCSGGPFNYCEFDWVHEPTSLT